MFDDCRDGFNIYEMDIHYFQFVKEKDKDIIVKSICDTKGTLNIKKQHE